MKTKKNEYIAPEVEMVELKDESIICASLEEFTMPDPWSGFDEQEW